MYDIIVVGAGPAGLTAALYAARANKSVILLEKSNYGGSMALSPKIENFPSHIEISGYDLSESIYGQVEAAGAQYREEQVLKLTASDGVWKAVTDGGTYFAKAVIIATGTRHKKVGAKNETEYIGNGISYCAACDGAFFRNKSVAVVGGGSSAAQEALYLADICKSVTVLQNLSELTAEKRLCDRLKEKENISLVFNTVITEFVGDGKALTGVTAENAETKETSEIPFDGVFVAIGLEPDNAAFAELIRLDDNGYILCDGDMKTDADGIFAAGDCRRKKIRQITTAMADGTTAAISACRYIDEMNK